MLLRCLLLLTALCCACGALCEGDKNFECWLEKEDPADSECATLVKFYTELIDDCVRPTNCCDSFAAGFNSNAETANVFRECKDAQRTIDACDKGPVISAAAALTYGIAHVLVLLPVSVINF